MTKTDKLNELKLTQAFKIFLRQLELSRDNERKKMFHPEFIDRKLLKYRVQLLIDRFVYIMGDDKHSNTISQSAKMVKDIADILQQLDGAKEDFKNID